MTDSSAIPFGQRLRDCYADTRIRSFWVSVAVLSLAFYLPLKELIRVSLNTELYSHIPLIPLVSLYFAWTGKTQRSHKIEKSPIIATALAILALIPLSIFLLSHDHDAFTNPDNRLANTILPYVLLVASAGALFLGKESLKRHLFSFAFLVFLIPMPLFLQNGINTFFQYTSAEVSYVFIKLAQIPIYRETPLSFELPTISLHVAPQCSGIRSSLVLFITSIVAGELFLHSKWNRFFLVLFVIPLAIFRNGLRIVTIAYLCVEYGPHMIESWIHHQGGPIFFLISLIPFFAALLFLWRLEIRRRQTKSEAY